MDLLSEIEQHNQLPFAKRPMKRLQDSLDDILNPVYEIEDFLQDRIVPDRGENFTVSCDNPGCTRATGKEISSFLYLCLDCDPDPVEFCSRCVTSPGQGINHDPTHRLLRLFPTRCEVCQGVRALQQWNEDGRSTTYGEYSTSGPALKRVAETRACGFCAFLWNALLQQPLDGIQWPPEDDKKVTVRVRSPRTRWMEIVVFINLEVKDEVIEVNGHRYNAQGETFEATQEFEVGSGVVWSHETTINPSTSYDDGNFESNCFARVHSNSGSDDALILAKKWLDACRETHKSCHESDLNVPPTRLIDLQGGDEARVYLREPCAEIDEYAALSYCWGDEDQGPGLTTKKDNIVSHRKDGIEIETLPKTIRETVHATKKLGLQYLWVDRLCIIQDSAHDWAHEAALMCAVYSGATVTLSADGSTSATQGLFQPSPALSKLGYTNFIDPDGDATMLTLVQTPPHETVASRCLSSSQPIDTRGWTMQERLMSRRILHFTGDEMAWECNTVTECECRRQSGASARELSPKNLQDMESIYEQWRLVTQAYAKRALGYDSDRLPALRGLVEKFRHLMACVPGSSSEQPDDYLAGLWKGDLMAQLAWKPPSESDLRAYLKATERMTTNGVASSKGTTDHIDVVREPGQHPHWRETDGYTGPSWSWVHLRGPISYLICEPRPSFTPCAGIIDAQMVPVSTVEPTGRLSSASITLKGPVVRGLSLMIQGASDEYGEWRDFCHLAKRTGSHVCHFFFHPDDGPGLERRLRGPMSDATLFLLGIEEHKKSGVEVHRITGIDVTRIPGFKQEATTGDSFSMGLESMDINRSLSKDLVEFFVYDAGTPRCSFFLVLIESQEQKGKYERIGCFEVWEDKERDAMETLFQSSEIGEITII